MGGKNFGWLAVWVPSPDWLCRMRRYQVLAFALQLRKIMENLSQGISVRIVRGIYIWLGLELGSGRSNRTWRARAGRLVVQQVVVGEGVY